MACSPIPEHPLDGWPLALRSAGLFGAWKSLGTFLMYVSHFQVGYFVIFFFEGLSSVATGMAYDKNQCSSISACQTLSEPLQDSV